ncbi:glycerol-3-phosphate dehydrogenase/oxidase [Isoptericola sp. b490]|uniref:glycerol-3-phosphate dehydrogenase/oxidase n=1 Tax=Actinotalea lenta TaxID=3064654 RepID=UPI00271290C6|nr:glycerol-3-phosphate dehydrogenase/oxidase [Isoptericola sp. b490]MDO8120491.1 glycerol-3-phosphate dehydrogenase/oxidase [Isoptericola sp. b490]
MISTSLLDVLVIGGGITGVSVALDAAMRGLRVGLVERDDFASGTSSASSKMVHGGLRYIEQREFRIVYHSLLERQRMYERAPHLVRRLPFLFPVRREAGPLGLRMAKGFEGLLVAYDAAGGWRIGRLHRRLGPDETLAHCPTLQPDGLRGGLLFFDTRTDDARLTLSVARTAAHEGAMLANHCEVSGLEDYVPGRPRVVHLTVRHADGSTSRRTARARVVVNATGVWSDEVNALSDGARPQRIRPAKGVHVVVPWERVRSQSGLVFPMLGGLRGRGGRGFVVRWGDYAYLGTTDTAYQGDLDDPRCERHEAELLLESLNGVLTTDLSLADVTGTWAGLRPLIDTGKGDTAELSREHDIVVANGIITVAGGKLTTSRSMAEQVVDRACTLLEIRRPCRTTHSSLVGGAGFDAEAVEATGGVFAHLSGRYGTEARFVQDISAADSAMAEPIARGLPYIWAEAVFAVRHEMAATVFDVLSRRIPARLLNSAAAAAAAPEVGRLLASELGVPDEEIARQVDEFLDDVEREHRELRAASD